MSKPLLILLYGRSCVGKTTTVRKLQNIYGNRLNEAVSTTTRPARPGEIDGVDYHFVNKKTFAEKIDDCMFIEFVNYNGSLYGLEKSSFDKSKINIAIVEPDGVEQIKTSLNSEFNIVVVKMEENDKTIFERFKIRGDSIDTVYKRFPRDKKRFSEIDFDYQINSDTGLLDAIIKLRLEM